MEDAVDFSRNKILPLVESAFILIFFLESKAVTTKIMYC